MTSIPFSQLAKGQYFRIIGNPQNYIAAEAVARAQSELWLRMGDADRRGGYPFTAVRIPDGLRNGTIGADWLVEVADEPDGLKEHRCERCGWDYPEAAMERHERQEYPWDGSDTEGSISETVVTWTCADVANCRDNRRANAEVSRMSALADDLAAREAGRGGIGGLR